MLARILVTFAVKYLLKVEDLFPISAKTRANRSLLRVMYVRPLYVCRTSCVLLQFAFERWKRTSDRGNSVVQR